MGEWFILIIVLTFHFDCFLCYWSIIVWYNPYYLFLFLYPSWHLCWRLAKSVWFTSELSILFCLPMCLILCQCRGVILQLWNAIWNQKVLSTSSFLLTQLLWLFVECNGSIWKLYLNIAIEILSKPPSIMEIS